MHGAQIGMAKSRKPAPVAIEHLRLAYELEPKDSPEAKRIREINKFLGRPAMDGEGNLGAGRLTAVRVRGTPVSILLDERKIGGEEFMAVMDIELAFFALTGGVAFKPVTFERVDGRGYGSDWPEKVARAVNRYQAYADHWSMRKKRWGDRTLEIMVMAVIDEWPLSVIEHDIGLRHGKAKIILIRALRDYAARAEWVDKRTASTWRAEAGQSFPADRLALSAAVWRARTSNS